MTNEPSLPPSPPPPPLSPIEVRVLGALIEKEFTTPDYYPLTVNALVNACNQKNNRHPMMTVGETVVKRAMDSLRDRRLGLQVTSSATRVPKYRHAAAATLGLAPPELAVLCELMLRGPQTDGELRSRAQRMVALPDTSAVDGVLQSLMNRPAGALLAILPREPGRRERRYAHLLGGPVTVEAAPGEGGGEAAPVDDAVGVPTRLEKLEAEVAALRAAVEDLRSRVEPILSQLG